MKTSIIILTYNKLDYTKSCIESVRSYTKQDTYEIIVVDNNSTDGTRKWLKLQKDIKLILNDENVGFPKGCNMGIEVAKAGNDILLLNNDTIVTPNWLDNLKKCLYSDEMIGAVGAVTNNCSYHQAISVDYKDINEMIEFARKYNESNTDKWERRVKLVGFCMLIKRTVLDRVGLLDEIFTPGNFEDDDYSYRVQEAGYKLYLCKDTFIHHFGSVSFKKDVEGYNRLMAINAEKFRVKWGFNSTEAFTIRGEIIEKLDNNKDDKINVLEIGCACGATLIKIKYLYKNANVYGIESNEKFKKTSNEFININIESIESLNLPYKKNFFDYIIFSDSLEKLYDPWKVVNSIKKYLKPRGKLIASIHNIMHYDLLKSLLNGNWNYGNSEILDKKHIRFFTLKEIDKMLVEAKYTNMEYSGTILDKTINDDKFIDNISQLVDNDDKQQYLIYKYIIKAVKLDDDFVEIKPMESCGKSEECYNLKYIIRRIENDIEVEKNLNILIDKIFRDIFNINQIRDVIIQDIIKKEEVFNIIALGCYLNKMQKKSLQLLTQAYQYNPFSEDTVYNLCLILKNLGDTKMSLSLLNKLDSNRLDLLNMREELICATNKKI